jgi:hypothetical protein
MGEVHKVAEPVIAIQRQTHVSEKKRIDDQQERMTDPPRVHSPISFCLQQASLKSVTGDNSA